MTRFLAVVRRIFLSGIIFLILAIYIKNNNIIDIFNEAINLNSVKSIYCVFLIISPVLFLIMTVISVIYIRKNGQMAAFHSQQPWIVSFFRCLGHDLISPFKNVYSFLISRGKNTDASSKAVFTRRFILLLVIIFIGSAGLIFLID